MKLKITSIALFFLLATNALSSGFKESKYQVLDNYKSISAFTATDENTAYFIGRDTLDRTILAKVVFLKGELDKDSAAIVFEKPFETSRRLIDKNNFLTVTSDGIIRALLFLEAPSGKVYRLLFADFDSEGNKVWEKETQSLFTKNVRTVKSDDSTFFVASDKYDFYTEPDFGEIKIEKIGINEGVNKIYAGLFLFNDSLRFNINSMVLGKNNKLGLLAMSKTDSILSRFIFFQMNGEDLFLENTFISNTRVPFDHIAMNKSWFGGFLIQWNQLAPDDLNEARKIQIQIKGETIDTLISRKLDTPDKSYKFIFHPFQYYKVLFGSRQWLTNGILKGDEKILMSDLKNNSTVGEMERGIPGNKLSFSHIENVDSIFYIIDELNGKPFTIYRTIFNYYPLYDDVEDQFPEESDYYFDNLNSRLCFKSGIAERKRIEVFNQLGELVYVSPFQHFNLGQNHIEIDPTALKRGVYFFRLVGEERIHGKFLFAN